MIHRQSTGFLFLCCRTEQFPLCGVKLFLTDCAGYCCGCGISDSRGMVRLPVFREGMYRIWAAESEPFAPSSQGSAVCLSPFRTTCLTFPFLRRIQGALQISLRDENYPEYTLPKGVFTLWRIY